MKYSPAPALLYDIDWSTLALLSGVFWAIVLGLYGVTATVAGAESTIPLIMGSIGAVYLLGGLVLSLRAQFEVFPIQRYILGGLVLGVFEFIYLASLLYLFLATETTLLFVAMVALLGTIPAVLLRKFSLAKRLSLLVVVGVGITVVGAWISFGMPTSGSEELMVAGLALSAMIAHALTGFWFRLDLMSPWVAAFWKGLLFLLLAIVMGWYGVQTGLLSAEMVIAFPVYQALLFGMVGVFELLLVFFKRKARMAPGLIAYKEGLMLATLIGTVLFASVWAGANVALVQVLGLALVLIGYLMIEERFFGIIGSKST